MGNTNRSLAIMSIIALAVGLVAGACGGGGGGGDDRADLTWTWVSGDDVIDSPGAYGVMGSPAPSNQPGARDLGTVWIDSGGNLWLFGGYGYDSSGSAGKLNDLWRFDGTNWTWISGSDTINNPGVYGVIGSPDGSNIPGGRSNAASWIDTQGSLWLFGGDGYDEIGSRGLLNDLWRYDGTDWTWVSGSNSRRAPGIYGNMGAPAASNVPGARECRNSWIDNAGNLWLFGGYGYDENGDDDALNDLWRFDGTNWTWMSGDTTINNPGIYGVIGSPAPSNLPGARDLHTGWMDAAGDIWIFGGTGYDTAGSYGDLNDLWRFDGSNWTWISGSETISDPGHWGSAATPATPGARHGSTAFNNTSGDLCLFGGSGYSGASTMGLLNDTWCFDGTHWAKIRADDGADIPGTYGVKGAAASSNYPGTRYLSHVWTDNGDNLWLFGGFGYDINGDTGRLNDLWNAAIDR